MKSNKDLEDDAPFFGIPGGQEPENYPQNFNYSPKDLYPQRRPSYKGDGKSKKD